MNACTPPHPVFSRVEHQLAAGPESHWAERLVQAKPVASRHNKPTSRYQRPRMEAVCAEEPGSMCSIFSHYSEVELTVLDKTIKQSLGSGQKLAEITASVCHGVNDITALSPSLLIC